MDSMLLIYEVTTWISRAVFVVFSTISVIRFRCRLLNKNYIINNEVINDINRKNNNERLYINIDNILLKYYVLD